MSIRAVYGLQGFWGHLVFKRIGFLLRVLWGSLGLVGLIGEGLYRVKSVEAFWMYM